MALDNAQFIAELSITDPPGTDPLSQGDDQIRTIKRATFQSFPNIDKAVTLTADQMNLAAIKNEQNFFTGNLNSFLDRALRLVPSDADADTDILFQNDVSTQRWSLGREATNVSGDLQLIRYDVTAQVIDKPFKVDLGTGVIDFAHVPTIAGAPIWTAGEVKMLVAGASAPGTNWFSANGLNGTTDLRNRGFFMSDSFGPGTRAPFIDLTAQTDVTGSTAITEAQMPTHRHTLRDRGVTGSGIADGSSLTVCEGISGTRATSGITPFIDAGTAGNFVQDVGGGSGHTHTIPAIDVDLTNNTDAFQIMPYSYHFQVFQYVP